MNQLEIFFLLEMEDSPLLKRFRHIEAQINAAKPDSLSITRYYALQAEENLLKDEVFLFYFDKVNTFHNDVKYDTELQFGKYKGKTMSEVVRTDFNYAQFLIGKVKGFYVNHHYLLDIIQSELRFSHETITNYQVKVATRKAANYISSIYTSRDKDWSRNIFEEYAKYEEFRDERRSRK